MPNPSASPRGAAALFLMLFVWSGAKYKVYVYQARAFLADAEGRKEARETRDRGPKGVVIHVAKSIAQYVNARRATDGGIICTPARAR